MSRWKDFRTGAIGAVIAISIVFGLMHFQGAGVSLGKALTLPSLSSSEKRTVEAYQATNESVVFITTISLSVDPFDLFPEYRPRQGTGSGVIIDSKNAIVLTNLHVIGKADRIEITLADGLNYKARLIGFDPDSDVAVIQIIDPPENLVAAQLGTSGTLQVGQDVLAIGNPFGLHRTLTTGIVSSLDRSVRSPSGSLLKGLIQTDAAINPGNSGGPLLDSRGRLIGINTAILSQSGDSAGIGFAVPIDLIRNILPELLENGRVRRAQLGWVLADTNRGPLVVRVIPGGPADKAAIEPAERQVSGVFMRGYVRDFNRADLIVAVNGVKVRDRDSVEELVRKTKPGEKVALTLRKGGDPRKERVIRVTPVF
jgi:S1-C subfamily serine protease